MAKKGTDYFAMFTDSVSCACQAAELLQSCLENYDPEKLFEQMGQMHTIEHSADGIKHDLMEQLVKEFLPPLEREDIMELAATIDDVTDGIEDVLMRMYMFNITQLRPDVKEYTAVIVKCCAALKEMIQELHNFRKSTVLREQIIEINHLEEEGDRLYTQVMRRLYTEEQDGVTVAAWTTIYDRLERCCDRCEDVADAVEQVIMKNS